jgi:ACS family tartrate transporter-like MFS transporter
MFDGRVLMYALIYFGLAISLYGVGLWLPQMIKTSGTSTSAATLLSAVPYLAAAIGMMIWGHVADAREGAPASNVWIPAAIGGLALVIAPLTAGLAIQLVLMSVAAWGTLAGLATFWTIPTNRLSPREMPVAIATINTLGGFGGFIGPVMMGWLRQTTENYGAGLRFLAAWLFLSTLFLVITGRRLEAKTYVRGNRT